MSNQHSDILLLGATGFTGRLITRYLAAHPQYTQGLFSFSIAGRSQSKLHTLVQELGLLPSVQAIQIDVTDEEEVEKVVKTTNVVINTVGPFWKWGSSVVRACARNGIDYVDLTGETAWIKEIILRFDYLATKTGAIIIPSCGLDSVPSDISAFLSHKTLKSQGPYDMGSSTTALKLSGQISGGSVHTILSVLEEMPKDKLREGAQDYSLSPVRGTNLPSFKLLYRLPIPGAQTIVGSFYFMQPSNRWLVQRTFGLLEMQAMAAQSSSSTSSKEEQAEAQRERYGPAFAYDEFLTMPSTLKAVLFTVAFMIGVSIVVLVKPVLWLLKKWMPGPGDGPSNEALETGFVECTNLTVSTSTPPVYVKTMLRGNGDPGYLLSAVMITESALCLVLPPPEGLPALARRGGVLTPMTAFGDALVQRLVQTGRFEFESGIIGGSARDVAEGRKDI